MKSDMRDLLRRDGATSGRSTAERAQVGVYRARHHWARIMREGPRSVVADDLQRAGVALRRFGCSLGSDVRPGARPIFIVGAHRSGTGMLVHALRKSPSIKVYNESKDSAAFRDASLRSDEVVRNLVMKSRCRCVAFKSLHDSHRIVHLLEDLAPTPGRAIWIYRSVEGRVRSILARFGDANLRTLRGIADGTLIGWQRDSLSEEKLELVQSFDYDHMTPESASALGWYLRNSLVFELDLSQREDVLLVSYEAIVAEPARGIQEISMFLDVPYSPRLHDHIAPRPVPTKQPLEIDGQVCRLCAELYERLEAARRTRRLLAA